VVNLWNSLPNRVVMPDSTNIFKKLRIDWTAFGKVRILFMTLEHNCMERPEVDLRYVLSNFIE